MNCDLSSDLPVCGIVLDAPPKPPLNATNVWIPDQYFSYSNAVCFHLMEDRAVCIHYHVNEDNRGLRTNVYFHKQDTKQCSTKI